MPEQDEYRKPEDHIHTSGPQDQARLQKGTGTKVVTVTRPEGRVSTWKKK